MYHLCKGSRVYTGIPYCGPASHNVPAEVATVFQAQAMQEIMTERNPVGWRIYNAETKELIG